MTNILLLAGSTVIIGYMVTGMIKALSYICSTGRDMKRSAIFFVMMIGILVAFGCGHKDAVSVPYAAETAGVASYPEGKELVAAVSSMEEAEDIAGQYGIELLSYSLGVAVYHTEEDPYEVIKRGEDNGWPALEINAADHTYR